MEKRSIVDRGYGFSDTTNSGFHGLAFGRGTINFWLQSGAVWNNERYGYSVPDEYSDGLGKEYGYTFAGSRLSSLKGGSDASHAGVIFQNNNKDITIDNYSGYTRVFYKHNSWTPTDFEGGDIRIGNAEAGSVITFTTDSEGLKPESAKAVDKNLVNETLNALAKKLYYAAYKTSERNLTGKVEIAEGLTTSSASKRIENITFDEATGQGGYAYTPAVDPEQTKTAFTSRILGTSADQEYTDANVRLSDGTYLFTKDSSITYQNDAGTVGAVRPNADIRLDAEDRALTIKSGGRTSDVKEAAAIINDDGKAIEIKTKELKLLVNDETSAAPLQFAWGIRATGGTTSISGTTDIEVSGTKDSRAVHASGGTVTLANLRAKTNAAAEDAVALFAQNDGRIEVNTRPDGTGDSVVMLDGDIVSKDAESQVELGLQGKGSYIKGLAYGDGEINLLLQNNAVWQNGKQGTALPIGFTGSHVNYFRGGDTEEDAGVIFQNDDRNLTIHSYLYGCLKVFFAHDVATPTNIKGGDLVIEDAFGGTVTLVTDNAGLNTESTKASDVNLVNATLNALANKLYYATYTEDSNLKGMVQIVEGLTTSAASKRLENITFDTTGRGRYIYTPLVDPQPGTEQTQTEFTTSITGEVAHDAPYVNAGVRRSDGQYVFTKDTVIRTDDTDTVSGGPFAGNTAPRNSQRQSRAATQH